MDRFSPSHWSVEDLRNPYPIYERYRTADPVHQAEPGSWYVFDFTHAAEVLSSSDFVRRIPPHLPAGGVLHRTVENWLVFQNPPRHTYLRRILTAELSAQTVTRLRPRIANLVVGLARESGALKSWDVIKEFAAPLPILVISELLGVPASLQTWFRQQAEQLQTASSARVGGADRQAIGAESAASELTAYFEEELRRRRGGTRSDLVTLLSNNAELTPVEATATCIHLLTAGHETTTLLLGKAVLALDQHRHLLERFRRPSEMPGLVEELIRYDPPVQMVTRHANRDRQLGLRRICAGDRVTVVLGAASRDPDRFHDPDRLWPGRDASRHCGFGFGVHYCLGAPLARAEVELAMPYLMDLVGACDVHDVSYGDDLVFHGPAQLLLTRR
jgi:cytochrome P450